jgi:hypothetical protein
MRTVKIRARNLFLGVVTFFCAMGVGYAHVDIIVEVPTAAHKSGDSNSATITIMGGESTSEKDIITEEEEPFWTWYSEVGYESEYNFRGTNLTPGAEGAGFIGAEVSKWDFTLGFYAIHQFGTARADTFAIRKGGGDEPGTFNGFKTIQTRFNQLDLFIHYDVELGPVDLTFGDVEYFDERRTETFLFGSPFPAVENEEANELFIRLSTSKIPHLRPSITYYQTIYSAGFTLVGYLEAEVRGNFIITKWLDFNPYGVISVNFHERREPVKDPNSFKEIIKGRSLSGFNHAEVGVELPIHLFQWKGFTSTHYAPPSPSLDFVPFGAYSYHISEPPPETDRNEVWGGAKFALTF